MPTFTSVLGILREHVADEGAAPGAERQLLEPLVLLDLRRDAVHRRVDGRWRAAHGQAADDARRAEIPLRERTRHLQDARDVVEAVTRVVRRQQVGCVDLDGEQVADRVGVLEPVQPMRHLSPARIRSSSAGLIEALLDRGTQARVTGFVRTRHAGRWHQTDAQLADHLLPGVGVLAHLREVHPLEHEIAGLGARVVATHAVAADERLLRHGLRGVGSRRRCRRGSRLAG